MLTVAVIALSCGWPLRAGAQDPNREPETVSFFSILGALTSWVNEDIATKNKTNTWGPGVVTGIGMSVKGVLVVGGEFGFQILTDKASFWENTTGGRKRSGTGFAVMGPFVGVRTPGLRLGHSDWRLGAGLQGGMTVWRGARGIAHCFNCTSEPLHVRGGYYIEPSINFFKTDEITLRGSFRMYLGRTDVKRSVAVVWDQWILR